MTNAEIEQRVEQILSLVGEQDRLYDDPRPLVREAVISIIKRAYEEAAREADDYGRGQVPPLGASCTDAKYIAMCIRLLKQEIEAIPASV